MEALRKIIDSDELQKIINLPDNFKNRKLELVILPASESYINEGNSKKAKGFLSKFKNLDLIDQEEGAWEKVVADSHGDN